MGGTWAVVDSRTFVFHPHLRVWPSGATITARMIKSPAACAKFHANAMTTKSWTVEREKIQVHVQTCLGGRLYGGITAEINCQTNPLTSARTAILACLRAQQPTGFGLEHVEASDMVGLYLVPPGMDSASVAASGSTSSAYDEKSLIPLTTDAQITNVRALDSIHVKLACDTRLRAVFTHLNLPDLFAVLMNAHPHMGLEKFCGASSAELDAFFPAPVAADAAAAAAWEEKKQRLFKFLVEQGIRGLSV